MVTGLTDSASVRDFWPEFNSMSDSQLAYYIQRAEVLMNSVGDLSQISDLITVKLAANLLVRRLYWWDSHPAASAEPANVDREAAPGLSYGIAPKRSLAQILGDEVSGILSALGLVNSDNLTMLVSEEVFHKPLLSRLNPDGTRTGVYVPDVDGDEGRSKLENWHRLAYPRRVRGV